MMKRISRGNGNLNHRTHNYKFKENFTQGEICSNMGMSKISRIQNKLINFMCPKSCLHFNECIKITGEVKKNE